MVDNKDTEGYIISKNKTFIGKIRLIDIINKSDDEIIKHKQIKPLILDSKISLLDTIKKLSNFVGESVPIVDKSNNNFIGIISENDVLEAYLNISDENLTEIEVIYLLYKKYNTDFFKLLNGQFSIVIYDFNKMTLILSPQKSKKSMPKF